MLCVCVSALAALGGFTLKTPQAILELKLQITFVNFSRTNRFNISITSFLVLQYHFIYLLSFLPLQSSAMLCIECVIICFVVFANGMYLVQGNCLRHTFSFGAFTDENTMVYGRWHTRIENCMQWLQFNEVWPNKKVLCCVHCAV